MGETSLTAFSLENHRPSTVLSMDSSASSSHDELDLEMNRQIVLTLPPDINLPLSAERSPTPNGWNSDHCDILDVGLGSQMYENVSFFSVPKIGRKFSRRMDTIWGAWVFFTYYFKPVLNEKSKAKLVHDGNGVSGFQKSDLQLDVFMVQHDMENMYMWVFKERPENALGKMQLRSYMNGHSRQGERPFPFSVDKGFLRSHRMQRKHYRGLSNPQCVHGVEVVPSPTLVGLDEDDIKRWIELTGRELDFVIPPEASGYSSWRNAPNSEFEPRAMSTAQQQQSQSKKLLNGSVLNLCNGNGDLSDHNLSPVCNKRNRSFFNEEDGRFFVPERIPELKMPHWLCEFSGVLRNAHGPVTAAKSLYEDEEGYLILITLPFVDLQTVKVSWRNTPTNGIIKILCVSTSGAAYIQRNNRTFRLADPYSEHCPPGEFIREIPLSTRIPENAKIEAYFDDPGAVLEILVPKVKPGPVEHEVHVCLRPGGRNDKLMLS
ncbi:hypothetical protein M569_10974 [Genlisea aurea]|uniref:SHSP domain-containing protein n=1 Tax=Genlisea aurea TaxID=192259 RepID=S8DV73_9LAMI|nr:hypothetical protein M569_10974 [Genlisea aurea]